MIERVNLFFIIYDLKIQTMFRSNKVNKNKRTILAFLAEKVFESDRKSMF
jgi:hypothetical protein